MARNSLIGLLDDDLRETFHLPPPSRSMALRVRLTAQAYMRGTPVRTFHRDRFVQDYFGHGHVDPHDLEKVGFEPGRHRS